MISSFGRGRQREPPALGDFSAFYCISFLSAECSSIGSPAPSHHIGPKITISPAPYARNRVSVRPAPLAGVGGSFYDAFRRATASTRSETSIASPRRAVTKNAPTAARLLKKARERAKQRSTDLTNQWPARTEHTVLATVFLNQDRNRRIYNRVHSTASCNVEAGLSQRNGWIALRLPT